MYFLRKYKERMMVALVAIILLVIIGFTSRERVDITKSERLVGNLLTPVSKVTFNVRKSISDFFGSIFNIVNIKDENELLKQQVIQLESENRDLSNIIGKSDYLKNEAKILEVTNHNLLKAQIISKEPGNWYDRFIIDKGLKDGVVKGATIIQGIEIQKDLYQEGIIGRVVDVGDNWAKVITIIDEFNSISFKIIRTQDGGILTGNIDSTISGYLFDNKADIIVGDKLYTSGLGESYINDIYIGEVSEVISNDDELTKRLIITPAINFKKLYNVFVILE